MGIQPATPPSLFSQEHIRDFLEICHRCSRVYMNSLRLVAEPQDQRECTQHIFLYLKNSFVSNDIISHDYLMVK